MKPKSAIQKGKDLENYISDLIESKGLGKARRSIGSGSGNKEKADIDTDMMINGCNIGIECKNHSTPHVKEWWKQAEKLSFLNRVPVVIYKLRGEPYPESKVIINVHDFIDLCVKAQEPKTIAHENSREDRYKIEKAINSLKDLLKILK